jgi:hypothetical protein
MKKLLLILVFISYSATSQNMTIKKLEKIITQNSDSVEVNGSSWNFSFNGKLLICIADENANRMRIITPIAERKQLNEELLLNSLVANFHTALDVKYALSDEILWSVFTHPLKELTEHQVKDAIAQVYNASANFGTTFSSTTLSFPGNTKKEKVAKRIYPTEKI